MLPPELKKVANHLDEAQTPYAIATVVRAQSPTAGKPGDKAIITNTGELHGWIGGGCAQPAAIKTARKVIEDNIPQLVRVTPSNEVLIDDGLVSFHSSCLSGGTLDIFIEPMYVRPVLWIYGSSPVAMKLASLASIAEYDVRVASPLGTAPMFPTATYFQDTFDIDSKHAGAKCIVIVATQGKKDLPALESALRLNASFIGFVASQKKALVYKEKLIARGLAAKQVEDIKSPIGKDIGARSASDIAISILSAVTQYKNANDMNGENSANKNEDSSGMVVRKVTESTMATVSTDMKSKQSKSKKSELDNSASRGSCCG